MGAPKGNCNAAKSVAKCKATKGWYGRSGSRTALKNIWKSYHSKGGKRIDPFGHMKKIRKQTTSMPRAMRGVM